MQDPSLGPFDPTQVQIHDFNPGDLNEPGQPQWYGLGGAFWTGRVAKRTIQEKPGRGDATFALQRYPLEDYFDVVNAAIRAPDGTPNRTPIPARAWVNVSWRGTGETTTVTAPGTPVSAPFTGRFHKAIADVRWTAKSADGYEVTAHTGTDDDVHVASAFTGRMRSGSFA